MKTATEITTWLRRYLRSQLNVNWLGQNATLTELGLDSISLSELIVSLEKWLEISIPIEIGDQANDTDKLIAILEDLSRRSRDTITGERNYKSFINPYLATKLEQLKIDRTFVRARGSYLFDEHGREYIDFMAQYGALPFGHHPPDIWNAIQQLQSEAEPIFTQPSFLHSAGQLAERLISLAPSGLRYVTFSNSGAESVEVAIKMARSATRRTGILSTRWGFHGKTLAALSATGNTDYQKSFGAPLSGFEYAEFGDIESLERCFAAKPDYYAAFIVEPIQGEGGVNVPPPGYLREVKEICGRYGVLLIVDEVQTGLGRTGALFACQEEGICPDIMTLAKALGGGIVPIGAILATERAYSEKFALKHSSTFAGNALAARAGLATLDLLTRDNGAAIEHVRSEGAYLKSRLEEIRAEFPWPIEGIHGRGFMLGIRFTSDRSFCPENFLGIAAEQRELGQFVASYLLNVERVRLAPTLNRGNVLRIQPPLNATREQCDRVIGAIERTVAVLASGRTGIFYQGILRKTSPSIAPFDRNPARSPVTEPIPPVVRRFAFLVHPLDEQSYADYDPTLDSLTPRELREFAATMDGLVDPVVGSTAYIRSLDGTVVAGDFILIGHTAEQLKAMYLNDALAVLREGLELAKQRGAGIVGLGAYTSVVSGGGQFLADAGIPLTSGNSYTVVSGIDALDSAVRQDGNVWEALSACVWGATGAIGSSMAALLAERVSRLILIGNRASVPEVAREKLLQTARAIVEHVRESSAPVATLAGQIRQSRDTLSDDELIQVLESSGRLILTTNPNVLAMADVVVSAISQPGQYIDDDLLKPGAIVCDISRPGTLKSSIVHTRPDVIAIDGGIVALPNSPRIGPYGIASGTSYACMAETILLALDGHFQNTSLGRELKMSEILRQKALAEKHGFKIAGLRSFGKLLTPQDWYRYLLARSAGREPIEIRTLKHIV